MRPSERAPHPLPGVEQAGVMVALADGGSSCSAAVIGQVSGRTPAGTGYTRSGTGEPLVLIHGVGMQRGVWQPQIRALAEQHHVVVYDMLGHGDSPLPASMPSLADYVAQLVELLDHLGLARVNVAGHSMGALVALAFALDEPARTLRVAAINGVYQRTPEQRLAVQRRADKLREAGSPSGIPATLARWFGEPPPAAFAGAARQAGSYLMQVHPLGYARTYRLFATADDAHAGRLATLAHPALFLTGADDANSSPAMSAAMAAEAPRSVLHVIPDARHMMTMTHPERVNAILSAWLATPV